ncbi:IS66-like element accessory protein TnpA [Paraburkholderia sp. 32]|uniref:IS66-like element accessory protein TnpA n=1 Tax=unclassified Paraburkholderia TaxID=2615204 RepID=UPI003D25B83F
MTAARSDIKVVPIIFDLMDITVTESEAKPGSRKGRLNYDREFRRRLAAAACEPGASVAKLARDNGINANMLFTWRRRYREQLQAETTSLIPVAVVHETPPQWRCPQMQGTSATGLHEPGRSRSKFGDVVVKVDGIVDADTLRVVLGSMRS